MNGSASYRKGIWIYYLRMGLSDLEKIADHYTRLLPAPYPKDDYFGEEGNRKFEEQQREATRMRSLYEGWPQGVADFFTSAQDNLYALSSSFNSRIGKHYRADDSRTFLQLIRALDDFDEMVRADLDNELITRPPELLPQLRSYLDFLRDSDGSEIPPETKRLNTYLLDKTAVFSLKNPPVNIIADDHRDRDLQLVDRGSYATVFRFHNRDTGELLALKRAKDGLTPQEMERFKLEYETMHKFAGSPFIVTTFQAEPEAAPRQYVMEYMPFTLLGYIKSNNNKLSQLHRKVIAHQFLQGLNVLHRKKMLHRDLSPKNVLINPDTKGDPKFAIYVKLSDFGLVKIKDSSLTRTDTSIKGMYNRSDPQLESYKDYAMPNEIHAAGWIINFIFSGKDSLDEQNKVWPIVRKATSSSIKERYKDEQELWEALNTCIEESLPTQDQLPSFPQQKRIS